MDDEALDLNIEDEDEDSGQDFVISTDPIIVTDYSNHARYALQSAEAAAAIAPGGIMTCEHLLLSLCGNSDCAAAQVLAQSGFPATLVATTIAFVNGSRTEGEMPSDVVLSPRVERVLVNAGVEAGNRRAEQVDTLHLLIALVRERQGVAALALETPGVGHEPVGAAISQAMRNGLSDPS